MGSRVGEVEFAFSHPEYAIIFYINEVVSLTRLLSVLHAIAWKKNTHDYRRIMKIKKMNK